jgi:hypothetical protein
MTDQFREPLVQELTVDEGAYNDLDYAALTAFGAPIAELSYVQAAALVTSTLLAGAAQEDGFPRTAFDHDSVVVDADEDGTPAFVGYSRRLAEQLAEHLDDEREIVISVRGARRFVDIMRGREPEITEKARFRTEPQQYA